MLVTRIILKNWRNFREADVPLREQTYLLGANASGKSNFLDVFRFLRDVSKPGGGGLQKALRDRDGITKIRCLHARKDPEVRIEVHLADDADAPKPQWRYILAFRNEAKGTNRTLISCEEVWEDGKCLLNRPDEKDRKDSALLTQTLLEDVRTNGDFRDVAEFFGETTYLHLVPQLLKYGDRIGGERLEHDPFGQGFLERVARTSERTRDARLRKIQQALVNAVPQFEMLELKKDLGRPHLVAKYKHWRSNGGWQREEQFSDGTLRLIGLLWSLLESDSLLLLEEPELSLDSAIVEQIPLMLHRVQRASKRSRQVILSTHSSALLENKGIDARGVLLLDVGEQGSTIRKLAKNESTAIKNGLSIADVVLPQVHPTGAAQLSLGL